MVKLSQVLLLLNAAWTLTRGDVEVSCQLGQSCILPCSFSGGDDTVIHWSQLKTGQRRAHSFYHNQDQMERQDAAFKGRTSLFHDQISQGNTSLLLKDVMVEDESRYKCYSSVLGGNQQSFINLKVYALVQNVNIEHLGKEILCSSDGIYPKPTLTWSPNQTDSRTRFSQTEQKLYDITSSVPSSDSSSDIICTVSTSANSRSAILKPTVHQNILGTQTSISCGTVTATTSVIWRFNHSEEIMRGTAEVPHSPTEKWKKHIDGSLSEMLILKHLHPNLTGIYTCEIRNETRTVVKSSFLYITEDNNNNNYNNNNIPTGIIIGVVAVLVLVAAVAAVIICKKKQKKKEQDTKPESSEEMHPSLGTPESQHPTL